MPDEPLAGSRHRPLTARVRKPNPDPPTPRAAPQVPVEVLRRALDAYYAAHGEPDGPRPDADPLPRPDDAVTPASTTEPTPPPPAPPPRNEEPRPPPAVRVRTRRPSRWWSVAAVLMSSLALAVAGVGAYAETHHAPAGTSEQTGPLGADRAAADWIAANVGVTHVIACDVSVCGLLRADGFPESSLVTVRAGVADVELGDVVVITPLLRAQLGASLGAVVADEPVAVFGTAPGQTVVVDPVALDGPVGYSGRGTADTLSRQAAGMALLANSRLVIAADARNQLADGRVDSRVCAFLALVTGSHAVTVAAFTPLGPGAGPSVPSAGVVISSIDGQSAVGGGLAATALLALAQAQHPPYQPLSERRVVVQPVGDAPISALQVLFAQPGPLGLLSGAVS